jgi:hypothetical protein
VAGAGPAAALGRLATRLRSRCLPSPAAHTGDRRVGRASVVGRGHVSPLTNADTWHSKLVTRRAFQLPSGGGRSRIWPSARCTGECAHAQVVWSARGGDRLALMGKLCQRCFSVFAGTRNVGLANCRAGEIIPLCAQERTVWVNRSNYAEGRRHVVAAAEEAMAGWLRHDVAKHMCRRQGSLVVGRCLSWWRTATTVDRVRRQLFIQRCQRLVRAARPRLPER